MVRACTSVSGARQEGVTVMWITKYITVTRAPIWLILVAPRKRILVSRAEAASTGCPAPISAVSRRRSVHSSASVFAPTPGRGNGAGQVQ